MPALQMDPLAEMQEIFVEYGKTASLTLEDGTKITLDAGSTLSYPKHFAEETREIYLKGEAFFEVAPNPQKPFIINANEAVVRVVGTRFNVKAWPSSQAVQVAVAEGKVSLRSAHQPEIEAVLINRGQLSALSDNQTITQPVAVDINKHLAWLKRELVLDNTVLSEVLTQLERWYRLQFELPDPIYKSVRISGVIKKKPINDIIETIAMMINLEAKREGNQVVFLEKSK